LRDDDVQTMVEITLIELNVDEPSFAAGSPFGGSSSSSDDGGSGLNIDSGDDEPTENAGGRSLKAPVLGFFLLVGAAFVARRLLAGEEREKVTA
jgi:hypothetical protein